MASRNEFVADPVNRLEIAGLCRVVLELGPQSREVVVDCSGRRELAVPPDLLQELVPADHFPGPGRQVAEDPELLGCHVHRVSPLAGIVLWEVHYHVAEAQGVRRS